MQKISAKRPRVLDYVGPIPVREHERVTLRVEHKLVVQSQKQEQTDENGHDH